MFLTLKFVELALVKIGNKLTPIFFVEQLFFLEFTQNACSNLRF